MVLEKVISEKKHLALQKKMQALDINEKDLQETFVLGGGKGGQKVNKSATCVYLNYPKLTIEIKCQKTRSRALNRYYARKQLCEKVDQIKWGKESTHDKLIEKQRKQKKRRKRRSKQSLSNPCHPTEPAPNSK